MALFDRLIGSPDEDAAKIGLGGFTAGLNLWALGLVTRAEIIAEYGIDQADEAELDWLKTKYAAAANKDKFLSGVFYLLVAAEDGGKFGLDDLAIFQARVTSLTQ